MRTWASSFRPAWRSPSWATAWRTTPARTICRCWQCTRTLPRTIRFTGYQTNSASAKRPLARPWPPRCSCGALIDLPENVFIVPRRALRDEGTSYHYMPPSRWSFLDYALQDRIKRVFLEKDIAFTECDTWTTDAIFRETVDKVRRCRSEGCGVVDMECAALSAVAEFRNVQYGHFLYVADTLADADAYDARNWGADSLLPALKLCIEIAGREDA